MELSGNCRDWLKFRRRHRLNHFRPERITKTITILFQLKNTIKTSESKYLKKTRKILKKMNYKHKLDNLY